MTNINVTLNLIQSLYVLYNLFMSRNNAVYIMTNYANTTFYIGVTNNLLRRIWEHKTKAIEGFTSRYNIKNLFILS